MWHWNRYYMVTKIRFVCLEMWRVHTTLVCLILGKITTKMVRVRGEGIIFMSRSGGVLYKREVQNREPRAERRPTQAWLYAVCCVIRYILYLSVTLRKLMCHSSRRSLHRPCIFVFFLNSVYKHYIKSINLDQKNWIFGIKIVLISFRGQIVKCVNMKDSADLRFYLFYLS